MSAQTGLFVESRTGNVGIGTTNPKTQLNLTSSGVGSDATVLTIGGGGTNSSVGIDLTPLSSRTGGAAAQIRAVGDGSSNAHLSFWTTTGAGGSSAVERMRILNNGNVGIGTTLPTSSIDIIGSAKVSNTITATGNISTISRFLGNVASAAAPTYSFTDDINIGMYRIAENVLGFSTAGAEAMRINATGQVSIGTTNSGYDLRVGAPVYFEASRTDFRANGSYNEFRFGTGAANGDTRLYMRSAYSTANGIELLAGSYATFSSIRLKTNVQTYTKGLLEVMNIRPVTYNLKDGNQRVYAGFIAEEIADAGLTEFVSYNDSNEPESLNYSSMVVLCVSAIKELKLEVDSLKAEIALLKA